MKAEILYLLSILFAIQPKIGISSLKYDQINDYIFQHENLKNGGDSLTFICAKNPRESSFFEKIHSYICQLRSSIYPKQQNRIGRVDFKDCRLRCIASIKFEELNLLENFIGSDLELEKLEPKTFRESRNLVHFDVSQNRLTEIPKLLFHNNNKLAHIDFSNNQIDTIDSMAFVGAENLQSLNLANNRIQNFDASTFIIPKLTVLDLSKNNLTHLDDSIFATTINLKELNLSFNPLGNLTMGIFARLLNLEYLNLKQTNLTAIQLGTFSYQQKLVSLDLSRNHLKQLDFSNFLPVMPDLQSLYLNGNHLSHLEGFVNVLFPKLATLDIKDNSFNCSYLKNFMKSVNWEKLRLPIDYASVKPAETNIRGIKCELNAMSALNSDTEYFIDILIFGLIFVCIMLLVENAKRGRKIK